MVNSPFSKINDWVATVDTGRYFAIDVHHGSIKGLQHSHRLRATLLDVQAAARLRTIDDYLSRVVFLDGHRWSEQRAIQSTHRG